MKHVVSVSLGTSKRDKKHEVEILGEQFLIERIGCDGDLKRFAQMFTDLDGKVDALGVGGADIYLVAGTKRYAFKQVQKLISGAKKTPVVDGSGLKHTLERETIRFLQSSGVIDFSKERVLMMSGVDRFGMAEALEEAGAKVVYGDVMFAIGLPMRIRSYRSLSRIGRIVLPIVTRLPFRWFYPTGDKQEKRSPKHGKAFAEATIIAGDWHYIRRYAPDDLEGKTIITNTLRKADLEWLRSTRARRAITTTPMMDGETLGNNVMEGVIIVLAGKRPEEMTDADYFGILKKLDWKPNVIELDSR